MKKTFSHIHLILLSLTLASLACNLGTPTATPSGTIGGIISGDTNGNGISDSGEGGLDNVIVTLTGCGEPQTVLSGANGYFEFSDISTGVCLLEVTKGGWEFSSAAPDTGYPMPVTVEAGKSVALSVSMRPSDTSMTGAATAEPTTSSAPTDAPLTATPDVTATPSAAMVSPTTQDVNCRFGPSIDYAAIDALLVGDTVPIIGRTADSTWWQVEGPRYGNADCFVAANVTQTSGDLSNVPVVSAPAAFVTDVQVHVDLQKGTYCKGPHDANITATIVTNGPTTVEYRFVINSDSISGVEGFYETIEINQAGETFVDMDLGLGVCGDFNVEAQVKSPNQILGKTSFSIPGPSKNGIPAIENVEFSKIRSGGNLTVYQDVYFQDSDGDTTTADWTLIAINPSTPASIKDGTVSASASSQIGGTSLTGTWKCGTSKYTVTLQLVLIDKAEHSSAPYQFSFKCD